MTFDELKNKLFRVINPNRFRFLIIFHSSDEIKSKIKNHLTNLHPDSLTIDLDLKNRDYQSTAPELYKNNSGFVFINDFSEIIKNPLLYDGFNRKRDKIAKQNYNLVCFIPLSEKDFIFQQAPNVIPDLWEFRNATFEI